MSEFEPSSSMYERYFEGFEVKPAFEKEYVSLWAGWLGLENCYRLDMVTEEEWSRFNCMIEMVSRSFRVGVADPLNETVLFPAHIEGYLSDYKKSMNKSSDEFDRFVIPDLDCVITEEWDYTYIRWHRRNGAVIALEPYILASKLFHFSD